MMFKLTKTPSLLSCLKGFKNMNIWFAIIGILIIIAAFFQDNPDKLLIAEVIGLSMIADACLNFIIFLVITKLVKNNINTIQN